MQLDIVQFMVEVHQLAHILQMTKVLVQADLTHYLRIMLNMVLVCLFHTNTKEISCMKNCKNYLRLLKAKKLRTTSRRMLEIKVKQLLHSLKEEI